MRTAKVIVIGDSFVGKTSLRSQFVHHSFSSAYRASIGADFLSTRVTLPSGEGDVYLQIWDTAGQEKFNSLGHSFYRGADVCVLVYDCTSQATFNHLDKWLRNFLEHSGLPPSLLPPSFTRALPSGSRMNRLFGGNAPSSQQSTQQIDITVTAPTAEGEEGAGSYHDSPPMPLPIILLANKTDVPHEQQVVSFPQAKRWARQRLAVGEENVFEVTAKDLQTVQAAFARAAEVAEERADQDVGRVVEGFDVDGSGRVEITRDPGSKCC